MSRQQRRTNTRKRNNRKAELWGECRRKLRYRTVESVEQHRMERERETGVPLTFYCCRHCGCYHLTKDHRRDADLGGAA